MKTLTRAEEQVMQAVWHIKEGFIRDIMDTLPSPKPHQNTVATILKILIEKEFVSVHVIGRQHQYYPLVSKQAYSKASIKTLVKGYFDGSFPSAVSFMIDQKSLSIQDLEALITSLKKEKNESLSDLCC